MAHPLSWHKRGCDRHKHGFNASYKRSNFGFSAVVLAEKDGQMERDYDYSSAVFAEDLEKPEIVGQNAAHEHCRALAGANHRQGPFR